MAGRWLTGLIASLLAAASMLPGAGSERAFAGAEMNKTPANAQTLFRCSTDRRVTLRASGDGASKQSYSISGRQAASGDVRLIIDTNSRAMTLFIRSRGEPTRAYVLTDVEQGSSLGSGASGKADTTIRGKSGDNIFTLFAGYDNRGADTDAALQVNGPNTFLLACAGGQYSAPTVNGLGRVGASNIYVLSADGLAREMKELPDGPWPYLNQ